MNDAILKIAVEARLLSAFGRCGCGKIINLRCFYSPLTNDVKKLDQPLVCISISVEFFFPAQINSNNSGEFEKCSDVREKKSHVKKPFNGVKIG